ncbi:MAG TPA: TonB-dependent receptor [Candidatus Acidoferrales bacterium]|nr:TonB-dependent receptor [Candidatus Acidoferrales bacterium]
MRRFLIAILFGLLLLSTALDATIFGLIRGVVHDPQHRPVSRADVTLKAANSNWMQTARTNDNGEFEFAAVPVGEYTVTVTVQGFNPEQLSVVVRSDSSPVLHFALSIAGVKETTVVSEKGESASTDSVTTATLVSRADVEKTPGADRTNSLALITDYVPGSYMTHDQLHIRGGHQVSWLVDGVPVPNTNIASNVGPQFDPKDIDYLEVQRGGYDAGYGDRTYGVFNVVPRTGFERDSEGELIASLGDFYQTNDQINFGGHTQRFAYYASFNGNRSNLGLESPVGRILHDQQNGFGGFGSLIYNANPKNQLRLVTSLRRDFYQIPNTPEQQAASIRDAQREADAFVNFSWVRTFGRGMLLTVSPFYHFNSANFDGGPNDFPISTTDKHSSRYAGGQATLSANLRRNDAEAGFYGFGQRDNQELGLTFNDLSNPNFRSPEKASGSVAALFLEDKLKVASWLTLSGGIRQTHFSGGVVENASSPRAGVAIKIPSLNWVLRAFYGQFYQAPPLLTASGPLLQFVNRQNLGFIPLRGERDEETQMGIAVPLKGWLLDADTFRTRARNYFDHNSVGNSDVFFPLTIQGALVRGWELTIRSPMIARRAQIHLAYSNQVVQGSGGISGGLTDFSPPSGFFLLDHDQRNTLNVGFHVELAWKASASGNVYYGSGFSNGEPPPEHLPGHTTLDLSLGKAFGERLWISLNGLNVANRHLLLDNSLTFGGTHFNHPREIYLELRYKFHY